MANRRTTIPDGWQIVGTKQGPRGDFVLWKDKDGYEIALLPNQKPDEATLNLLMLNGVEPKQPGELTFANVSGDDSDADADDDEPAPETAVDRILATFGKMDRTAERPGEVRVYRLPVTPGGTEMYCAKFTPEDFERDDLEPIARTYGAGTYRIRVMGATPKYDGAGNPIKHGGKFVRLLEQVIEIGAPISTGQNTAPVDPMMRGMLDRMEAMNRQILELAQTKGAQPDMMTQLRQIAEIQSLFGGGNNSGKPKSIVEMADEFRALKEMAGEFGSGGESEGGMMGAMKSLLPMLQAGMAAKATAVQSQPALPMPRVELPQSMRANPAPAQMQPAETQPQNSEDEMQGFQQLAVNAMVAALCKEAAQNSDVTPHAQHLAEMLPDEMIDLLDSPIWFGTLAEMYPAVEPHKEWFTKLRDAILVALDGPAEEPVPE